MMDLPVNYARVLSDMDLSTEELAKIRELLTERQELTDILINPLVLKSEKRKVIERLFPQPVWDFVENICDSSAVESAADIFAEYDAIMNARNSSIDAVLTYVTAPDEAQIEKLKAKLAKEHGIQNVNLKLVEDPSLMGGFILTAGKYVLDRSVKTSIERLERHFAEREKTSETDSTQVVEVLRKEIESYDNKTQVEEIGRVMSIGDGIANVYGLQSAMYGELLEFENGTTGIAQNLEHNSIGCVLLGSDRGLVEGSAVKRTGKQAGVAVGEKMIGRVVNALGEPIDGEGPIETDDYRPVENKAPGVITRKEVSEPLQTGILAIDSMFPIGRGQRELIIGDRQTGKTSIAIDAIINQRGQDVICIYVAIGQKASTVAKTVNTLKKYGAMEYTIVVNSPASESAPLQYIAPYTGAAIGEHFMDKGKDVLIVYDDLSKHAQAYRAMSLLLHRPPGREAYPGDVFYLHSRLLERACRRSPEYGGGSMTALPIIETQAGDVSAYIPTNVISITDGQIFLETDLFFAGVRPAVNVGLSVSRVGGKAQTKVMKNVAGSLRVDLAQYREMEVFTQFSSDLDDATKELLAHGRSLMELLKQPLCKPMPLYKQVILLCAANEKVFIDIPLKDIERFKNGVIEYIENTHAEIVEEIMNKKVMTDELKEKILSAVREYKNR